MNDERRQHWDRVHAARQPTEVSWFQERPERSLRLIQHTGVRADQPIIDIGGGASRLVDHLLAAGFSDVTVLDVSATALGLARARLGESAARVTWIEADITLLQPARRYHVWHDRAVFHFLTDEADRRAYARALATGLDPGGFAIVATFGPEGPERCSGLPVVRYGPEALAAELGLTLMASEAEMHRTPAGKDQQFVYCRLRVRKE